MKAWFFKPQDPQISVREIRRRHPQWSRAQIYSLFHNAYNSYVATHQKLLDNIPPREWRALSADPRPQKLSALVEKYKVTPLMILRRILNKKQIKKPARAGEYRDLVIWAKSIDLTAPETHSAHFQKAMKYEETVEKIIQSWGIGYQTQEELVAEQTGKYGRPLATPDFLLQYPVLLEVNKKRYEVNWVDAKDYLAYGGFMDSGLREQAKKYTGLFGPGAFIFSQGIVDDFYIPSTCLISGDGKMR